MELSNKYVMTDSKTLLKIMQALSFKGGSASTASLKIAVMLDDNIIQTASKAGEILEFIETEGDEILLTELGEELLEVSSKEKQDIVSGAILKIEGYRDIIFRMKMVPSNEMAKKDISKAFYILEKDLREELRKQIIKSFVDFSIYANLIENNGNTSNPGYILTSNGEKQLDLAISGKKRGKKGSSTSKAIVSDLTCPSCGKGIMPDFQLCPYCGTALKRTCSNCGKELQPGWKICPFCGQ